MYKRDFGILLLSAFAIYFSLRQEGAFSFRKAWYHFLDEDTSILEESDILPPPVVADLNGDGKTEVIIATHDGNIQVLAPRRAGRAGSGFAGAPVIAQVALMSRGEHASGKRAVALAAGYLDAPSQELVRALRKQVVVVVTAGWRVLCFDHNLRLMWDGVVKTELSLEHLRHATVREVAIHISNHAINKGDRGLVVIGGSVDLGDIATRSSGETIADEEVLEAEMEAERGVGAGRRRLSAAASDRDVQGVAFGGADVSRHFSYYAFEGASGVPRWHHEGSDFHRDAAELAEQVIPQHNYRLDAAALSSRHYGEVSCREFRESVLAAMPHSWSRRSDTKLQLAHFYHHRHPGGANKKDGGAAAAAGGAGSAHAPSTGLRQPKQRQGVDHTNPVAKAVSKVAKAAARGGGGSDPSKGGPETPKYAPNVLVAHLEEGIEAIHLYSGRTLCKLHLPGPGLHADLNGDGVLDHVQATDGRQTLHSDTSHKHAPSCWAIATSGIPPTQPLFNGSVCRFQGAFSQYGGGAAAWAAPTEVAPPVMLQVPGRYGHYRKGNSLAVFLNSRGEVTAYDGHGKRAWQVVPGTTWVNHQVGSDEGHKVAPTLVALALRVHATPSVILAAGEHEAVVLSEHGHRLADFTLPAKPVIPLQVGDFNGDGLNDVILVARDGLYGYVQIHHPGGVPFSALLGCLIVVMGVVYFTQLTGEKKARKGRSTDRTD